MDGIGSIENRRARPAGDFGASVFGAFVGVVCAGSVSDSREFLWGT